MTFTWLQGRELSSIIKDYNSYASYSYDSDGIRKSKSTGGVTTTYYVEGGVCYGESRSDGVSLQYLRDETGKVIGYTNSSYRLNDQIKSSGSHNGWFGGFGKASVVNATGEIGFGNDDFGLSLKAVGDVGSITGQAGLHYKDGVGVAAKGKASLFSGRITAELNICDWEILIGLSGDIASIGGEISYGRFLNEDGKSSWGFGKHLSYGPYGWGYVIRITPPD